MNSSVLNSSVLNSSVFFFSLACMIIAVGLRLALGGPKYKYLMAMLDVKDYSKIIYNSENKTLDNDGKVLSSIVTKAVYQFFKNATSYDCNFEKEVSYFVRNANGELVQNGETNVEKGTLTPAEYLNKGNVMESAVGLRIFNCEFREGSFSSYLHNKKEGTFSADITSGRGFEIFWNRGKIENAVLPMHIEVKHDSNKFSQIMINYGNEKAGGKQIKNETIDFQ